MMRTRIVRSLAFGIGLLAAEVSLAQNYIYSPSDPMFQASSPAPQAWSVLGRLDSGELVLMNAQERARLPGDASFIDNVKEIFHVKDGAVTRGPYIQPLFPQTDFGPSGNNPSQVFADGLFSYASGLTRTVFTRIGGAVPAQGDGYLVAYGASFATGLLNPRIVSNGVEQRFRGPLGEPLEILGRSDINSSGQYVANLNSNGVTAYQGAMFFNGNVNDFVYLPGRVLDISDSAWYASVVEEASDRGLRAAKDVVVGFAPDGKQLSIGLPSMDTMNANSALEVYGLTVNGQGHVLLDAVFRPNGLEMPESQSFYALYRNGKWNMLDYDVRLGSGPREIISGSGVISRNFTAQMAEDGAVYGNVIFADNPFAPERSSIAYHYNDPLNPVPEPSLLAGLGLAGLIGARGPRKHRKS